MIFRRAPRRLDQPQRHFRIERVAPVGTVHGDREQAGIEILQDDVAHGSAFVVVGFRHSGMVRKHQTRNLEISDVQLHIVARALRAPE